MPLESRVFIRTSLVALVLTFVLGTYLAYARVFALPSAPLLLLLHPHLGAVGWLVNLVIGFALWLLPLNRAALPQSAGRYPPAWPWIIYALLNGGFIARFISEPFVENDTLARVAFLASGPAQCAAIVLFLFLAWARVRRPNNPAPGVR